ncbi:MAG: DUF131 domain-containing protein [Candidatus Atabeyarchaeum deiterrae]
MTRSIRRLGIVGITFAFIGILTIFSGFLLDYLLQGSGELNVSFGGVVMIGPIPVIFGTDRTSVLIAVIGAAILMVSMLILMCAGYRKRTYSYSYHRPARAMKNL